MQLTFATRSSILARWQTQWVMQALQAVHPDLKCSEVVITTWGDQILDKPLPEIGGKGLFTKELENELLFGNLDVAVHSLKDLPVENEPGLVIGAVPLRGEVRDVLVSSRGFTLDTLPNNALVGTSSLRRAAQLLAIRPDIRIMPLRGNINTRVQKVMEGQYQAIVLAGAGLERLGMVEQISQWLPLDVMLPAPGQGALAVQCRSSDAKTRSLLAGIDDPVSHAAVTAERQFLSHLGGGCAVPVGAYGRIEDHRANSFRLDGIVASLDGSRSIRVTSIGDHPAELGKALAEIALSEGATDILEEFVTGK